MLRGREPVEPKLLLVYDLIRLEDLLGLRVRVRVRGQGQG